MRLNRDLTTTDFWLIRHAPSLDGGAMAGRRDVDADCSDAAQIAAVAARVDLRSGDRLTASPALRTQQTSAALFARKPDLDARLREQDFGAWEGLPFADLPDLGPLPPADLVAFAPPQGESFDALCARVWPALQGSSAGRQVIVAHAGVIRAALGLALGTGYLGLGFSVAPLSVTRLVREVGTGVWAVHFVNWTA